MLLLLRMFPCFQSSSAPVERSAHRCHHDPTYVSIPKSTLSHAKLARLWRQHCSIVMIWIYGTSHTALRPVVRMPHRQTLFSAQMDMRIAQQVRDRLFTWALVVLSCAGDMAMMAPSRGSEGQSCIHGPASRTGGVSSAVSGSAPKLPMTSGLLRDLHSLCACVALPQPHSCGSSCCA